VITGGDADEAFSHLLAVMNAQAVAAGQGFGFDAWNVHRSVPATWTALHTRYRHQDPSGPLLSALPPGHWWFVDRSPPVQQEADLYRHFRDAYFGDGAIARIYSPFVSDLFFVIYRARGKRFGNDDHLLLQTLYPHLASGLAARRALAALRAPSDQTLHEVLRGMAGHAIISFPSRTVSWSSGARRLWKRRLGVDGDAGWARLDQMLLHAVERFHGATITGRSQLLIPGVRVELANVPPERGEVQRMLALLMIDSEPLGESPAPAEALLTPRQRTIARALCAGRTLPEIARELGLSLDTVRGYAKEIHQRLGVRNRSQLVAALSQRDVRDDLDR
jgi:DNA-binding CsgD family transcriptional regulator